MYNTNLQEFAALDIDLLTRCVLVAQTSRLEAAYTFRNALNKLVTPKLFIQV